MGGTTDVARPTRDVVARALAVVSVGLLAGSGVALTMAWIGAIQRGAVPDFRDPWESAHSIWAHYYIGLDMLTYAMVVFPPLSFMVSGLSLLFKPSRLGAVVFCLSIVVPIYIFLTYAWLID
jgi:hypothetical protein